LQAHTKSSARNEDTHKKEDIYSENKKQDLRLKTQKKPDSQGLNKAQN